MNLPANRIRTMSRSARAGGFSMIELLIAIAMALFLGAGMIAIVFSMRTSFKAQDGLTQMQENLRFMLTVLDTTVHNGGYFTDTLNSTALVALPVPATANGDGSSFAAGQFITGTTGAANGSDSLDIRFQTDSGDGLMNCNGDTNTSGAKAVYTNSFAISAKGELTCAVAINGGVPDVPAILIDNVATMKVLYGVDTDGTGNVDTYQTSAAVAAAGRWNSVSSVQLTFTLKDLVNSNAASPVNMPKKLLHTINLMNKR